MQQRINWTGYLLIGITSLLAAAVVGSCRVITEYSAEGDYMLINETDHTIRLGNEISIPPRGRYEENGVWIPAGKGGLSPHEYPALPELSDFKSVRDYIIFDEGRCGGNLYERNSDGTDTRKGYYDIRNYSYEKIENWYYRFTYRFTEQDYAASTPCEINVLEVVVANETDTEMGMNQVPWVNIAPKTSKTFNQVYDRTGTAFSLPAAASFNLKTNAGEVYPLVMGSSERFLLGFREKPVIGWYPGASLNSLSSENGQRCILFPAGAGPLLENLDDPKVFDKVVLSDRHVRYTYRVTKAIEAQAIPCGEVRY